MNNECHQEKNLDPREVIREAYSEIAKQEIAAAVLPVVEFIS